MKRATLLCLVAVTVAGCSSEQPNQTTTTVTSSVETTPTSAPTTTVSRPTTTEASTDSTLTTTQPTAKDQPSDSPGSEVVGVSERITIVILDQDGTVVGGNRP